MRLGNLQITRSRRTFANATDIADIPVSHLTKQYTTPGTLMRSAYDNGFAPISAIVDEILKRNLHLGDVNNPDTDVTARYSFWNSIARPNDRAGFLQFIDLLVSGFLSLEELSLLVWCADGDTASPGAPVGGFELENIVGYTVVPNNCKDLDSLGNEEWTVDFGAAGGGQKKFGRDSVITFRYSLLPEDGITGVSPGSASSQEAAIRDRLNQQQRALFDNGATPSIIVTIYARSHAEAKAIQEAYEKRNRGADKAGGVVYQTVIDDKSVLAGQGEPRIEITTVGMTNDNLALKDIVEFTQNTITSNYGVSPIIYGDATTTTFQNQNLADAKFMDRVQAILVRLCSIFEFEIARICSLAELPFTFVWDDTEVDIAEEQEIKARTNTERTKAFLALVQAGVSSAQATEMLGLDESWKNVVLALPETPAPPALNIFDEGCTCDHHKNALPARVSELEQSAQKKILSLLKKIAQEIFDDITSVENYVRNFAPTVNELDQALIDELKAIMESGAKEAGTSLVDGLDADNLLGDFTKVSVQAVNNLEKRASKIVTNYVDFVTDKIASLPDDDPAKKVFTDFYTQHGRHKAKLIAQQETKVAYQEGELDVAKNVDRWLQKNKPQSSIVKVWETTSEEPCRFCKRMNGTEAGIRDSFIPGALLEVNDKTLYLDPAYSDGTIPDAHANCQCVFTFKLVSK